ncbi:MAG: hypothetical protein P4L03_04280 [Terracidiphilus sp.]|nr:hypothetical protein [Terracidiphilus sp.]
MMPAFRSLMFRMAAVSLAIVPMAAAHALTPKADVFLGYSRLGNNTFSANAGSLNGWEGALNVKVKRFVGIEGDVAQYGLGAPAATPHTTVAMFGPRVTVGAAGVRVFVHALGGGEHTTNNAGLSETAPVVSFGGGGDVRIAPFFSLRVSADWLDAPGKTPSGATRARYTAGIVFRF